MMRRKLKGRLENLGLAGLFRLLAATGASGRLEVETSEGAFSLGIRGGRVETPEPTLVKKICHCLDRAAGSFSFDPQPAGKPLEGGVDLSAILELCRGQSGRDRKGFASDIDVDNLLAGEVSTISGPRETRIHLLPAAVPEHPLEDLLLELEKAAPEELLFAQVGVVTGDPRPWRGWIEREWRRRGWELRLFGVVPDLPMDRLDALVIHHRLTVTRVGRETQWLELLQRAAASERAIPVVWVGPLGDPVWVARLVEAGASFLLPAPAGEGGAVWQSFQETVTRVLARLVQSGTEKERPSGQPAARELVEALVHGRGPGERIGVLLQLASGTLCSGAVFSVDATAVRCRAGFGFPLSTETPVLPRGIAALETVIRTGRPERSIDPAAAGSRQLARVLGVEDLPAGLVLIPLQSREGTTGLLIGERSGSSEKELEELILIARRIGGVLLGP